MISFFQWLLSRGFSQPTSITSSQPAQRPPVTRIPVPAPEHVEAKTDAQSRRQLGGRLVQAPGHIQREYMVAQWAHESGLTVEEYRSRMHTIAANIPRYVNGRRVENDL